ncbi:extracellular solute-binding protein [Cohnella sp. LGH]|uniref:extracellular solute-binding protein n=1 Tax=Cohnella sp. LGH TaxID=1619153 RepID=UPI001AD9F1A0|nr:extracellular solute-binding protein [Cohnella sp. LGH]QTH40470.1 extracellular solute-binding protein [Cohnella sp. LGH]
MGNRQWKRPAGLLATTLALATALAACSGSNEEPAGTSSQSNESAGTETASPSGATAPEKGEPLGKFDPPIEVTTVKSLDDGSMKFPAGESIDNNLWTQGLEQELGVKLKVEWLVPDNQYEQKLNVTIASDDLPDITLVNAVQLKQLVDNDMVEDLTAAYEEYKSELTDKLMTSDGGIGLKQATFDGKLLAIPAMNGALDSAPVLWVRKDWLDNVGMQPPKTMDDLYAIAQAFTESDPDRNGQKDTYGLGLQKELFGGQYVLNGFFNGYHAVTGMPGNLLWNKDGDGKLILGYVQPEAKTALGKLADMYKAGYIEKDFAVKDGGKVSESVVSEKIGMFYGQHWNAFLPLPDAVKKNPQADWRPYAIPSVDGTVTAENVLGVSNFYVVRKGMKTPEAAVKILNYFLNKQNPMSENYDARYHNGPNYPEESHSEYKYSPISVFHPQQNILIHRGIVEFGRTRDPQSLSAWNQGNENDLKQFTENFDGEGGEGKAGGVKTENWPGWIWVGPFGAYSVVNEYVEKGQIVEPVFYGAPTPTMTAKQSTLEKLVLENYTKFIMGVTPIEQFDSFVQNWNSLGGAEITTEVNEWAASQK